MSPTDAVPQAGFAPLLLLAVVALAGCNRPADEVEPTPPLLEMQAPEMPGLPSIDQIPPPPVDPDIPAPPDPRGPVLPDPVAPPEPARDPVSNESTGTPVA